MSDIVIGFGSHDMETSAVLLEEGIDAFACPFGHEHKFFSSALFLENDLVLKAPR